MTKFFLTALLLTVATHAAAQESFGEREYMSNCASCHGANGKGLGPLAELLSTAPTNLTQLSAQNDGQFPFERVYRVIDGRETVTGHGSREMPVWGNEYDEVAREQLGEFYGMQNPELFVSGRILSLITYIQSIQE